MRYLGFCSIIFLLCACTAPISIETLPAGSADKLEFLSLYYYDENMMKSPFEPDSGCMTGASVFKDRFIHGDMEKFEELTQKSHDIYGYEMKPQDPLPMNWLLNCLKNNKLPLITLYPQNKNQPYDIKAVEMAAKTLNTYSIPMLLQFYPNPKDYENSEEYVSFFRESHEVFRKYAPKVSFIWSVSTGQANQGAAYYPGGDYVDWIGLSYYLESGEVNTANLLPLTSWYYEWQSQKPLLLFAAISHYSTESTLYTEQESADALSALYGSIKDYPRIKAVIYQNENQSLGAPLKAPRENYLVTDNSKMLAAYKTAISDGHFTAVAENTTGAWLKSPFDAVSLNGRIYIPINMVEHQLKKTIIAESRQINGKEYVSEDAFQLYKIENKDDKILITIRHEDLQ